MCGAQIVCDALEHEGVEVVFGYPGGMIIDVFDKINHSEKMKFVLVRHEQGAGHMADGYARASGKPGVCIATSGPGATNLVTALATAYMDGIPMIAITGQVPIPLIGNDAFQEADVCGITRPVTKHNFLVRDIRELANTIHKAFFIATTGKPGPVLVDVPKDVQKQFLDDYEYPTQKVELRSYKPNLTGNINQVKKAAEAIEVAQRPVLYVGGGVIASGAHEELRELAERCDIPVTTTLLALGSFPERHPLALEMLGMHGTVFANHAVDKADLIIAVGSRFDDRVTGKLSEFAPNAKSIVHIDIDPAAISKNVRVSIPIVGDCKQVLRKLLEFAKPKKHPEWLAQIAQWKEMHPVHFRDTEDRIQPQYVIEKFYEVTNGECIIATDVGQNQMWTAQHYKFSRPRQFLSSGGLGTMGFGLPAAIGAQFAFPDKLVVCVAGDGGIQMNIQELAVCANEGIPVKIIVLNNQYLGMVRQWQHLFYDKNYSFTYLGHNEKCGTDGKHPREIGFQYYPDFVKLAEAYGAVGYRVTQKDDVEATLKEAFATPKCVLMEFIVEPLQKVYPMIPGGGSIKQMILGPAESEPSPASEKFVLA